MAAGRRLAGTCRPRDPRHTGGSCGCGHQNHCASHRTSLPLHRAGARAVRGTHGPHRRHGVVWGRGGPLARPSRASRHRLLRPATARYGRGLQLDRETRVCNQDADARPRDPPPFAELGATHEPPGMLQRRPRRTGLVDVVGWVLGHRRSVMARAATETAASPPDPRRLCEPAPGSRPARTATPLPTRDHPLAGDGQREPARAGIIKRAHHCSRRIDRAFKPQNLDHLPALVRARDHAGVTLAWSSVHRPPGTSIDVGPASPSPASRIRAHMPGDCVGDRPRVGVVLRVGGTVRLHLGPSFRVPRPPAVPAARGSTFAEDVGPVRPFQRPHLPCRVPPILAETIYVPK